jgi:hypothetical protein
VVLPDLKKADADVVVFLDRAAPGCASAEEASERGAVAALHRVAGDRQLHLTLPRQFGGCGARPCSWV